jgi:hypothetical protein
MTTTHFSRLALAGLAIGIVMTAGAAQAFTFNDGQGGSSNAGSSNSMTSTDPVSRSQSRLNSDGTEKPTIRSGPTLQFGGRESFDQRNTGDRYFNPNNLMGR